MQNHGILELKGAIAIVESNFSFLQIRKLRPRDLPEFLELIVASLGLLIPGPATPLS